MQVENDWHSCAEWVLLEVQESLQGTVLWRGVPAIFFLTVHKAFKQCSVSETVIFCTLEKQKSILVYGKPII